MMIDKRIRAEKEELRREKAELYLNQLEDKLRYYKRVVIDSNDAVIIQDFKGIIKAWNKGAERIYGYREKEMIGKSILKIIAVENQAEARRNINSIERGKPSFRVKQTRISKDKQKLCVNITYSPIYEHEEIIEIATTEEDISELKRRFKEAKANEEKYVTLFNGTIDAIFIADPTTRKIVDCNTAAEKLLGFSRNTILSMKANQLHPQNLVKKTMEEFQKQVKGKADITFTEIITNKKKRIPVSISASVVRINNKEYLQCIFRDITEKKKIEEALLKAKEELELRVIQRTQELSESEKKYKALFESSRDAVMTLAPPIWKFTAGNAATIKMFNAKNEKEFVSLGPWELSPKYQPDGQLSSVKAKKMITKAMAAGSNFFEWTHKRIDDGDFPATVLLSRVLINGRTFLQATVRDISEEKEADEKVKQSEKKFRQLIENLAEGFGIIDTKGVIMFVNKALCMMWGYSEKEILGRRVIDFLDKKNKEIFQKEVSTRKEGSSKHYEITWSVKKGKVTTIVSPTPMFDQNGVLIGSFAVMTDMTQQKKMEEKIITAKEELAQKVAELERFNKMVVGRELKMIELKKKILTLEHKSA